MRKTDDDIVKRLNHIRCRYQPVQDRICITGDLDTEAQEAFWLTQRMVTQIVPHITQYIEKQSGPKLDTLLADVKAQLAKSQQQQADIRWRESAKSDPAPTAPEPAATPAPWLVVKMSLASTEAGCRLVFVGEEGDSVSVTLRLPALCRWLAVLHAQCQHAQWALAVWPAWVAGLIAAPTLPGTAVLH